EGYIAEHEMFADALQEVGEEALREEAGRQLVRKLSDDSTFCFEKFSISGTVEPDEDGAGGNAENGRPEPAGGRVEAHTAYPTKAAAVAGIVLCGIVGVLEALQDIRKRRFRGETALFAEIFTVLQSVLCGTAAALFIVGMTGKWSGFGRAATVLLLLAAAVFLVGIGAVRNAYYAWQRG
ncbi:MAG: hypothetical protein K2G20_01950, partial [Lachnospiraceae bacterium]|nr:hypothetical protein [Lachnospiraceae bacterium]